MATKKNSPGKHLVALAVAIVAGIVALTIGHFTQGATFHPKLALDLEGGTQLILTPRIQEGAEDKVVSQEDMSEAIRIIRQRVDASGVTEAEISTLGSNNIVVAIPGEADENILNLVRSSSTMRFRPVLQVGGPQPLNPADVTGQQSGPQSADEVPLTLEESARMLADTNGDGELSNDPEGSPENHSDLAWMTEQVIYDYLMLDCTNPESLTQVVTDDPSRPLAACQDDGSTKYILGPTDVEGTHLSRATGGPEYTPTGQPTGRYAVNLELDSEGTRQFAESSQRLYSFLGQDPTLNRFAVVLDGNVILAPSMNAPIMDGQAQITGTFTAAEAQALANQLQFGSLPLNFEVQSEQQISATLGSNHLEKGLWAGLIGLLLVVLYMVWQYRGLSLLSAGSLLVAGIITYLVITILSWTMGYRLSLPGVAGLVVAVGITADSFIVYFERIRDEVREGRPLVSAVEDGWTRARRTIIISDAVNLLAAAVLYILAVGGVQGFAFTLGVTTIVDLLVVVFFTHPVLSLLTRTEFFGKGHKLSGLDPEHLGARSMVTYKGRGRVDVSSIPTPREVRIEDRELVGVGSRASSFERTPGVVVEEPAVSEFSRVAEVSEGEVRLPLAERRRLARLAEQQADGQVEEPERVEEIEVNATEVIEDDQEESRD